MTYTHSTTEILNISFNYILVKCLIYRILYMFFMHFSWLNLPKILLFYEMNEYFPFNGNIRDTTGELQVYNKCPWGFHPGNSVFFCGFRQEDTPYASVYILLSYGNSGQLVVSPYGRWRKLHGTPRFPQGNMRETTRKPGFPTWKPGETTWKPQVSLGKHEGNPMETSSFPTVNIKETTLKPHNSQAFPWCRKLLRSGFQDSLMWKPQGNFRFPKRKSVGNSMETSGFLYVSPW